MKNLVVSIYKWSIAIKSFFSKIHQKGKERITVLLVPATEEHIKTLHIPYSAIYLSIALVLMIVTINAVLLLNRSTFTEDYSKFKDNESKFINEKKIFEKQVYRFQASINALKPEVSRMMCLAQNDKRKRFDVWGMGGATLVQNLSLSNDVLFPGKPDSEIDMKLRNIEHDLSITKDVISKMNDYIALQKDILDKLPTLWPIPEGGYVSSEFGWREHPIKKRPEFHLGLDIAIYAGAPIVATADGIVQSGGFNSELGNYLIINHAYGFSTRYGHCLRLKAGIGQRVKKGQVIAYVGKTGLATGYHLHYEIRIGTTAVDPWPYIIRMK